MDGPSGSLVLSPAVASPGPGRRAVDDYYHETWLDYRGLWMNGRNLAFHFGYYDEATRSHADALLNTNRLLAEHAAIKPGERVLDAGCGVGGSSQWLVRERGTQAVGVNLVVRHAAEARRRTSAPGPDPVPRFVAADYCETPFAAGSFDVVWAVESLCHAPDKGRFYREAARLLRPGGRLVVAEYMRTGRGLPPREERRVAEWVEGWAMPDLDTIDEHRDHARAAGLDDVRVDDFTDKARPSLRRLYRIARFCQPFDRIALALGIRSPTQSGNVTAAVRQYQTLRRGLWRYSVLLARKSPAQRSLA